MSDRELKDPEGCVFDLRLEKVFSLKGKAYLGIDERETPDLTEVANFNSGKKTVFIFKPGKYYLTKTIEEVNQSLEKAGWIKGSDGIRVKGGTTTKTVTKKVNGKNRGNS